MRKWEYEIIELKRLAESISYPLKVERLLNDWGGDGWELVSVFKQAANAYAFLKKPIE